MAQTLAAGCSQIKVKEEKLRDLDYTVVGEDEIPEELKTQIEEKKTADFKMTYEEDEYLYIIRGYGQQDTGGYSIQMEELYLTEKALYFKTTLTGPAEDEIISESKSFPYIVIKTEKQDKIVVFE